MSFAPTPAIESAARDLQTRELLFDLDQHVQATANVTLKSISRQ
jgi:predicted 2-oxoglutarate/Fe(II)-dependent dioxygenase YbiX